MSDNVLKLVVGFILVTTVCAILFFLHRANQIQATSVLPVVAQPAAGSVGATSSSLSNLPVGVGQSATLHNGNPDVDVAVDQAALLNLADAAAARNIKKYYSVFDRGRAFRVGDGTRVRIIGAGIYSGEVQILQGASAGRTGYVPQEWISTY